MSNRLKHIKNLKAIIDFPELDQVDPVFNNYDYDKLLKQNNYNNFSYIDSRKYYSYADKDIIYPQHRQYLFKNSKLPYIAIYNGNVALNIVFKENMFTDWRNSDYYLYSRYFDDSKITKTKSLKELFGDDDLTSKEGVLIVDYYTIRLDELLEDGVTYRLLSNYYNTKRDKENIFFSNSETDRKITNTFKKILGFKNSDIELWISNNIGNVLYRKDTRKPYSLRIITFVSDDMFTDRAVYIPTSNIVLSRGLQDVYVTSPNSESSLENNNSILIKSNLSYDIKIVDNKIAFNSYYTNINNKVIKLPITKDFSLEEGIYTKIYFNDIVKEESFTKLEDANNIGIYNTEKEAENRLNSDRILELQKIELDKKRIESNNANLKMEKEIAEYKIMKVELEKSIIKYKNENIILNKQYDEYKRKSEISHLKYKNKLDLYTTVNKNYMDILHKVSDEQIKLANSILTSITTLKTKLNSSRIDINQSKAEFNFKANEIILKHKLATKENRHKGIIGSLDVAGKTLKLL